MELSPKTKNRIKKGIAVTAGVAALGGAGVAIHNQVSKHNAEAAATNQRYEKVIEPTVEKIAEDALAHAKGLEGLSKTGGDTWRQQFVVDHGDTIDAMGITYKTHDGKKPTPGDVTRIQINMGQFKDSDGQFHDDRNIVINADENAEVYLGSRDRWYVIDSLQGDSSSHGYQDNSEALESAHDIMQGTDVPNAFDLSTQIIAGSVDPNYK